MTGTTTTTNGRASDPDEEEEEEEEYDDSVDIYGRVPSKEPRHSLACAACGRPVGVGRYAPHLDKCLGKGKAGRSGGSQRGKQNNSSSQQQASAAAGSGAAAANGNGGKGANRAAGAGAGAAAAAGGAPPGGAEASPPKKSRKRKDQNKHPALSTYAFPDAAPAAMAAARLSGSAAPPIILRLRVEKGGECVQFTSIYIYALRACT